jgi:hypothetical protein
MLYTKILYSVQSRLSSSAMNILSFFNQNDLRKFLQRDGTYLFEALLNIYIDFKDADSIAIRRL